MCGWQVSEEVEQARALANSAATEAEQQVNQFKQQTAQTEQNLSSTMVRLIICFITLYVPHPYCGLFTPPFRRDGCGCIEQMAIDAKQQTAQTE